MDRDPLPPEPPGFGTWALDFTDGSWWWSEEMLAMYDADLTNPGDVEAIFARMHPDDREPVRELLEAAMETRSSLSGQYRFSTLRRGQRTFAFVGDPVIAEDGTVTALRGYTIDVTAGVVARTNEAVVGATESRGAIEQVKGALMAEYRMDENLAFQTLRHLSMVHNVKLARLAQEAASRMSRPGEAADDMSGIGRGTLVGLLERVAAELSPGRDRTA